ncbi:hypothetical protein NHX12_020511 [Muraenolepis orangiensis]|uniref:Uncharacterized protein n=1 Tax=Muraenolepis orangiensis TaxID=630683 RepID=A0A9Q0IVW7_9TELE|nr:hypothetical protein NHX12_020511 [Muraenolepis orangiensis]
MEKEEKRRVDGECGPMERRHRVSGGQGGALGPLDERRARAVSWESGPEWWETRRSPGVVQWAVCVCVCVCVCVRGIYPARTGSRVLYRGGGGVDPMAPPLWNSIPGCGAAAWAQWLSSAPLGYEGMEEK